MPRLEEREAIFGNYSKQLSTKDLEKLAQESEGMSGRNIKDICEHAERTWASKYLRRIVDKELPYLSEYLSALEKRKEATSDLSSPLLN